MKEAAERFYRYQHKSKSGWFTFGVRYRETDLWIRARRNLEKEAMTVVLNLRRQLELTIADHPEFLRSLEPLPDDPTAPAIAREMLRAGHMAGVGPMASVAGAFAQNVALALKPLSPEILVENGGDCYLDLQEPIDIGIYAGPRSPFSGRIGLRFGAERFPLGICTSSGTVGHSLSFGKADAVTVVAKDASVADAVATALGNLVKTPSDIPLALEKAAQWDFIEGALITVEDKIGIRGNLELVPL